MHNKIKDTIEDICQFFIYFGVGVYPVAIIIMSLSFGFIVLSQYLFGSSAGYHILLCFWTFVLFISVFVVKIRKNHIFADSFFKIIYILMSAYHWFNTLKSLNSYTITGKIEPLIPFNVIQNYINGIENAIILCIIIIFTGLIIEGSTHIFYTWKNKRPLFRRY
jgi:hypothetical protein